MIPRCDGGVEEEAAHDLGEDVLGEARDAGVVEQDRAVGVIVVEEMMRQPADGRLLREAGGGFDEFDAAEDRAGLVLPAAAGGEHLLQRQGAGEQRVAVPIQAAQIAQRRQDRRREDAAGAEARAFRHGGEQGNFDAGAELAELLLQRSKPAVRVEAREEAGERERRLGQRERAVGPGEGVQLGISAHALLDPEVNRAHDQFRAVGELGEDLDGRLAVEVGGHVEHLAAVLDAVRGRIGPAAGQVEPDRAARPDDLVVHDVAARAGRREPGLVGDHLPQPGERAGLEFLPARLMAMPQDGGAEHLVVDQLHRVVVLAKGAGRAELSPPAAKARAVASRSSRKKTLQRKFLSIGSRQASRSRARCS